MARNHALISIVLACTPVCGWPTTVESESSQVAESASRVAFLDMAVTLPSPASVHLDPSGRLGARLHANINYLHYLYDRYGKEMLKPYANGYEPEALELFCADEPLRHWEGEYGGKWLDAAVRAAVNTGDPVLWAKADAFATSMRRDQQPDGYAMGFRPPTTATDKDWTWEGNEDPWEWNRRELWDVWNHWYVMTGQLTHYEFRGDRASLDAAAGVGDWIVKTFAPIEDENAGFYRSAHRGGCNLDVIGQLARLYRHTGNEGLREFAQQAIQHYPFVQQMRSSGKPVLVHAYVISAYLGGIAEWAQLTGDRDTLAWVEQIWQVMVDEHLYPTGSLGLNESLQEDGPTDEPDGHLQETCATVEWILLTERLYAITGHAKYVDALERTCYNALLAAQSSDGMKWMYYTPLRYKKKWFTGPTNCCYWSGPRGIVRLPELIYAVKDNTIYVNFFETSDATLATSGGDVRIVQDSEFPAVGRSRITLNTPPGWKGTLRVRVPGWTTEFETLLNGKPAFTASGTSGYRDVALAGSTEHEVEVKFDIPVVRDEVAGGYVVRRGPEVLAIDTRDGSEIDLDAVKLLERVVLEPADPDGNRRRYRANVMYKDMHEPQSLIFTPYADAGNEDARFRTVFPLAGGEN